MITPVMPTYGRWDVAVERGEGCYLWSTDGRKFLDFTSGIAVTSLGHCHPHVIEAVTKQAGELWHSSNLFRIPGQEKLAQRLTENSFADTVFFNNSGAEACELSLKVAAIMSWGTIAACYTIGGRFLRSLTQPRTARIDA